MDMTRKEAIKEIRTSLKRRSGKPWSVTGGRGTAWGWLTIDAPPKRKIAHHRLKPGAPDYPENYEECEGGTGGHMTKSDRIELAKLLDLEKMGWQGESIPASNQHWQEYIDRANGIKPTVLGVQYWD